MMDAAQDQELSRAHHSLAERRHPSHRGGETDQEPESAEDLEVQEDEEEEESRPSSGADTESAGERAQFPEQRYEELLDHQHAAVAEESRGEEPRPSCGTSSRRKVGPGSQPGQSTSDTDEDATLKSFLQDMRRSLRGISEKQDDQHGMTISLGNKPNVEAAERRRDVQMLNARFENLSLDRRETPERTVAASSCLGTSSGGPITPSWRSPPPRTTSPWIASQAAAAFAEKRRKW